MAELDRKDHESVTEDLAYSAAGHPSVARLMADQGTGPITDVATLHGDFWPEEESVEDFLAALHEWRGHERTDPAA